MSPTAILIAGPTASGKSALAVAIARELGGLVINADSMQVYDTLRILTARPSDEELAQAPHALYGHVSAAHAYSAAQWVADVERTLAACRSAGRIPVIVGGTGLYFKVLLEGLSPVPAIPDDVRRHWRTQAERLGAAALHAELAKRDAVMAERLRPTDPQRITRALEVLEATGQSLGVWQEMPGRPVLEAGATVRLCLRPARSWLQERCDARFEQMIAMGALDEVRALAARSLSPTLPAMRAIGVSPLLRHVQGHASLAEAIQTGKMDTRRFVKRQETWLKTNMMSWIDVVAQLNFNFIDIIELIRQLSR